MTEQKSKKASHHKWNMAGDNFNEAHKKLLDEYQSRPKGQEMYDALQTYQAVRVRLIVSNLANICETVKYFAYLFIVCSFTVTYMFL